MNRGGWRVPRHSDPAKDVASWPVRKESKMESDEQEIRELVSAWMEATRKGEVDRLLELIADDAVFLQTGRPIMRKAGFAKAVAMFAGDQAPEFDGKSEIQEMRISGDLAFAWTNLSICVIPPGGDPIRRAGYTLTVFEKQSGKWRLSRDANMLVDVPE